jgi:hypothetical protein
MAFDWLDATPRSVPLQGAFAQHFKGIPSIFAGEAIESRF